MPTPPPSQPASQIQPPVAPKPTVPPVKPAQPAPAVLSQQTVAKPTVAPASQTVYAKPAAPSPQPANSIPQPVTISVKPGQAVPTAPSPAASASSQLPPPTLKPAPPVAAKPTLTAPVTSVGGVKPAAVSAGQPVPVANPKPLMPLGSVTAPTTSSTAPGAQPAASSATAKPTGSAAPASPTAAPAKVRAEIKKPPFWLFAIVGVLLLGFIGYVAFSALGGKPSTASVAPTNSTSGGTKSGSSSTANNSKTAKTPVKQTTLIYWGLWEPTEVMTSVINEFQTANPEYKIDYRKQSHKDYRERLQTAIASGNGPDLFRMHASWVPMLIDDLAALPTNVMNAADFKKNFYPIAVDQLTVNNKIMGMPLMYDGLALYYNKEMLKTANAEPPQTWADLKALADSLTVPSNKAERGRGTLQRAGLAIGNATNVEHFSDIFGLLVKQNGGDLAAPNSTEVRDALLFYTNFVKEDKVWSDAMPSSTVAFARGDVAMMFAPSWRALDIKAMNPALDFGVAPMPKLGEERMGWASYWAEGVNSKSKNQAGAWAFIKFLAEKENQEKFFTAASQVRPFGEPYARQDMAASLASDPVLGSILADAPSATSWYLNSFTHDNGLNDQMIKYYGDAINATLDGKSVEEVLTTLETGVTKILRQYNVTK